MMYLVIFRLRANHEEALGITHGQFGVVLIVIASGYLLGETQQLYIV